jgi:HSP90 family molecular chaperone
MPERRYIGALQDTFTISDVGSTLLEDLAKGIYRPHEVIREYVQNGVDAHRLYRSAAGLEPERPIGIEIRPDKLSIFDFGVGMDDDDIKKVKSVAVSRKRDADVILTGHKGVGIWAGLSYFDVFVLLSFVSYSWVAFFV